MIYKGARAVIQSGAQLGTSQKFADASARKAQDVRKTRESAATAKERVAAVEETLEGAGLRGDDGVPPGYPTVTAEAFFHQVDLYWPRPPASDEVVGSLVRIRPENEASRIVSRGALSAAIKNLPHKPHTFEVLLFDKWGRESLWSDPVTATPMLTAAEEIDLGEIAMLGRLRGLLPNTNLATITDATKLADELVSSGKIAPGAVTGPKLPDGVINGPKLAASAVEADKIAANAVTAPKILSDQIQTRHITAGAVTASVMAAQDAAAFNLWAQNAMIRSAAIQSITADKISAGTMTAGEIALAGGGRVKAGQIVLNENGIKLPTETTGDDQAFANQEAKITSNTGNHAIYFRSGINQNQSVMQARSGVLHRGLAIIAGLNQVTDWDHNSNAMIRVGSYRPEDQEPSFINAFGANARYRGRWYANLLAEEGTIDIVAGNGRVEVQSNNGPARLLSLSSGNVDLDSRDGVINCFAPLRPRFVGGVGTVGANGGWLQWTHGANKRPDLVMGYRGLPAPGDRQPLPTPSGNIFISRVDPNTIRITNDGPNAEPVSCVCY